MISVNHLYEATNEWLPSIVRLLEPQENDCIAAVCGSGDQAFALLESGAKVVTIDREWHQIEYARRRGSALQENDLSAFLRTKDPEYDRNSLSLIDQSNRYFKVPGRLELIRRNLDGITFREGPFLEIVADGEFQWSKLYLSNILMNEWLRKNWHRNDARAERPAQLTAMLPHLQRGGLVYMSGVDSYFGNVKEPHPGLRLKKYVLEGSPQCLLRDAAVYQWTG